MKKIINKVGKGYSRLKNVKVKIFLIAILTLVMLIDMNPFFLKAGRETLVYTFENGVQLPFGFDNAHNSYSYYSISKMGGHIAYCMDYDVKNPPNGTGLQYLNNVSSNKVVAILMNGYPSRTPEQLGLNNEQEAYLATQMALWQALNGTNETKGLSFNVDKVQPNVRYSSSFEALFENSKKVTKKLLNTNYDPGTFSLDSSSAKVDYEYNDDTIAIGPYKFKKTGYSSLGDIDVNISGEPTGTYMIDSYGNKKNTFKINESFYLIVNKFADPTNISIKASSKANKYVGVVYGRSGWQNFVFLDTEQIDVTGSATATWEESKGNIKVVKVDQDSKPIAGAEFTLSDSSGKQIKTEKTDANGNISITKLNVGDYTLTETTVPDGYIIQKSTYPVSVKRNQTSTVEVQNTKVKGVLQITKLETKSKKPIAGAVFEVYDKDGNVIEKITTDASGIGTSKELSKGTYTYKEITVPDGYIMDTKIREFSITETINVVRETVYNEKIIGQLQLIKIGNDGEKPLEGAEFEIYDKDKKVVGKLVTDKNGKALSDELGKGTYTYKETKAPYGYELDTKEYTFTIETQKQVLEQSLVNEKIYGKLKITKVDENDKPIADVKFKILDENNKEFTTVTTDTNGIAIVENLPVGKYKYKEIDTPYLYILDDKEYDFEINSEKREDEVKIVNQRAKGILKIIKVDKDDNRIPIANAKFNVIDKSTNDIVDAIVTDENGVARTKALPTGEYMYQEMEVPDEYILESKTYDVKIKKNNDTVEKKVTNEHKKLPVTGGFLSTNGIIILIVTSVGVIGYVLFKIIRNKKDNPNPPTNNDYITTGYSPNNENNNSNNEIRDENKVEEKIETEEINQDDNSNIDINVSETPDVDHLQDTIDENITQEETNLKSEEKSNKDLVIDLENEEEVELDNSNVDIKTSETQDESKIQESNVYEIVLDNETPNNELLLDINKNIITNDVLVNILKNNSGTKIDNTYKYNNININDITYNIDVIVDNNKITNINIINDNVSYQFTYA